MRQHEHQLRNSSSARPAPGKYRSRLWSVTLGLVLASSTSFVSVASASVPNDKQVPPAESPPTGLVIGTSGTTNVLTTDALAGALLDPTDPDYHQGALTLSKDNITTVYSGGVTIGLLDNTGLTGKVKDILGNATGDLGDALTGILGDLNLGGLLGGLGLGGLLDAVDDLTDQQLHDVLDKLAKDPDQWDAFLGQLPGALAVSVHSKAFSPAAQSDRRVV